MKKRQYSPEPTASTNMTNNSTKDNVKRQQLNRDNSNNNTTAEDGDLLKRLSDILKEMKTTTSTGEISAELLGELRMLLLHIEELAADDDNIEARQLKDESDNYLELWFDELVAQCEADGEIDWASFAFDTSNTTTSTTTSTPTSPNGTTGVEGDMDDSSDEEDTLALALALQDEEDAVNDDEKDNGSNEATETATTNNHHDKSVTQFNTIELDDESILEEDEEGEEDMLQLSNEDNKNITTKTTIATTAKVNG